MTHLLGKDISDLFHSTSLAGLGVACCRHAPDISTTHKPHAIEITYP